MIDAELYGVKVGEKFVGGSVLLTPRQALSMKGQFLYTDATKAISAASLARAMGGAFVEAEVVRVRVVLQIRAIEFLGKHRKTPKKFGGGWTKGKPRNVRKEEAATE